MTAFVFLAVEALQEDDGKPSSGTAPFDVAAYDPLGGKEFRKIGEMGTVFPELRTFLESVDSDPVLVGCGIESYEIPLFAKCDPAASRLAYLDLTQAFLIAYPMRRSYDAEDLVREFVPENRRSQHRDVSWMAKDAASLFGACFSSVDALRRQYAKSGLDFEAFATLLGSAGASSESFFPNRPENRLWTHLLNCCYESMEILQRLKKEAFVARFLRKIPDYGIQKLPVLLDFPSESTVLADYRGFLHAQGKSPREPQEKMIREIVSRTFVSGLPVAEREDSDAMSSAAQRMVAIEAGTWTGKTYAYLIPTISFLRANPHAKAFVSVSTKILQEQIENEDLPRLKKHFPDIRFARLKANSDGIDLNKLHLKPKVPDYWHLSLWTWILAGARYVTDLHPSLASAHPRLDEFRYDESDPPLWKKDLNWEYGFKGLFRETYFENSLFVVNHSMNLAINGGAADRLFTLPSWWMRDRPASLTVFDEAHAVESVVRDAFTLDFSMSRFEKILGFLFVRKDADSEWRGTFPDVLRRADAFLESLWNDEASPIESLEMTYREFVKGGDWSEKLVSATRDIRYAFDHSKLKQVFDSEIDILRKRFDKDDHACDKEQFFRNFSDDSYERFFALFDSFAKEIELIFSPIFADAEKRISKIPVDTDSKSDTSVSRKDALKGIENLRMAIGGRVSRMKEYCKIGSQFFDSMKHAGYFPEFSISYGRDSTDVQDFGFRFIPSPLHKYSDCLMRSDVSVFVSATLFDLSGRHSYVLEELADFNAEEHYASRIAAPFDYGLQRKVVCHPFFQSSESKDDREAFFKKKALKTVQKIAEYEGRALVLCTSTIEKDKMFKPLRGYFENRGITVLKHEPGVASSRANRSKIEALKKNPNTVLVGSRSFSEGVDIPGDNLSLVIITRLPIVPPSPFLRKQNSLPKYHSVSPDFVTKFLSVMHLRQSVGRLIRSETDCGEICILDGRMLPGESCEYFLDCFPGEEIRTGEA